LFGILPRADLRHGETAGKGKTSGSQTTLAPTCPVTQNNSVSTYQLSVDIDAPADRVWDVMFDVEKWHEWTPSISSIERLDAGELRVGSRVKIRQPKLPPAMWTVTQVEPGRSFSWVSKAPGILVTGVHSVVPKGRSSTATLSIDYKGALGELLGKALRSINERYVAFESAGLKKRSEHPPATARLK
jgi:uncharacterized membrane protein